MGLLDSIRRWIDGEGAEDPLEQVDESVKPRRVWEEFLVKVAREVEAVMQREMFTPPGGATIIPREYIIFLSNEDDKEWQGEKRRGLEQGLYHVLSERARELAGKNKLALKSIAIELRVDGTLNKGEFRIQHIWDEAESGHTMVLARKPNLSPRLAPATIAATQPAQPAPPPPPTVAVGIPAPQFVTPINPAEVSAPPPDDDETEPNVARLRATEDGESDATAVRPRQPQILYNLEIWRDGVRQNVLSATKGEISIGRGSRTVAVDLPLPGDPEISRVHATLQRSAEGQYWLVSKGRNSTIVNGREINPNVPVRVVPDDKIEICTYTLRIQP